MFYFLFIVILIAFKIMGQNGPDQVCPAPHGWPMVGCRAGRARVFMMCPACPCPLPSLSIFVYVKGKLDESLGP